MSPNLHSLSAKLQHLCILPVRKQCPSFSLTKPTPSDLLLRPHVPCTHSRRGSTIPMAHSRHLHLNHGHDEEDDDGDGYDDENGKSQSFEYAVELFNQGRYYDCHDVLEHLWNEAQEPNRTLFHGVLQCAVGLHHLFNKNHRGAMMELGEGLCKLRKMNFKRPSPFYQFEQEISAALNFVYNTQIELAACGDDTCVAMDQSERSYQLLGGYAAGQNIYQLELARDTGDRVITMYIVFCSQRSYGGGDGGTQRVKLPTLTANKEQLKSL